LFFSREATPLIKPLFSLQKRCIERGNTIQEVSKIKITVLFFKSSALNYIVKCTVLEEKYNHGKNKRYVNELMMFT
jgi:hypothetical protein